MGVVAPVPLVYHLLLRVDRACNLGRLLHAAAVEALVQNLALVGEVPRARLIVRRRLVHVLACTLLAKLDLGLLLHTLVVQTKRS